MKPLDPRLLRYARSSRAFLVLGGLIGIVQTFAMIGFAWCISLVIVRAIDGQGVGALASFLWGALAFIVIRAVTQWLTEVAGAQAAARAKMELRAELLRAVAKLRPTRLGGSTTEVTTLATHGLEALDPYFGKYLPQLILTFTAMPLLIGFTFLVDPVSAITEVLTIPVIPLFMILIGWATQRVQRQQLDSLTTLANSFLEIIAGLSTLKVFGRARRQRDRVAAITEDYRRSTMKVLRLSFLSGFALELFASLAVALVAVQIGIRLIDNDMALQAGLIALILAPEVFAPLRQVGAQFHAASEGVTASQRVFVIIERAVSVSDAESARPDAETAPRLRTGLELRDMTVAYDGRPVLEALDASFARGQITAIVGESGAGKSTLLAFIRGELDVAEATGIRELDGAELSAADAHNHLAWMGQSPSLMQGTVRDNVALGRPDLSDEAVQDALNLAGLDWLDPARELGVGGEGLSGGQAQRLALARTIARARAIDAALVLADEPTSALDAEREQVIIAALRSLAEEGRAVIVVSHRSAVVAAADRVLEVRTIVSTASAAGGAD